LFEANLHRNKYRSCLDYFNEKRLKRNLIKKKQTNKLTKTKQNKTKQKKPSKKPRKKTKIQNKTSK
jgi:hypothetical protein